MAVDKQWIKCLFRGITFGLFQVGIRNVDNLSTGYVDSFESYPPVRTNVDKLSTTIVDNFTDYLSAHDTVDNLSTINVDKFEGRKQVKEMRGLLHKIT